MYPYSIYLGLRRGSYIGTLGSKYILHGYMEPLGLWSTFVRRGLGVSDRVVAAVRTRPYRGLDGDRPQRR